MKIRRKVFVMGLLLAVSTALSSCNSEQDQVGPSLNKELISEGKWKVNAIQVQNANSGSGQNHPTYSINYSVVFSPTGEIVCDTPGKSALPTDKRFGLDSQWKLDGDQLVVTKKSTSEKTGFAANLDAGVVLKLRFPYGKIKEGDYSYTLVLTRP
ncbi:hypothetical protein IC229_21750 [Spirosoma sp. BT702]|uniref:Lipocalin-like domain-containing protein n=1 Tax=Spirosoma profusum TaxID=2771354 RepID=A0A926XZP8_9BACT|nr:hypothetical protein [Spirosoma profusum]MBD2703285.1 hypothetical protein [Spirosoma profusum]